MKRLIFAIFVLALIVGGYYFITNNGPARVTAAWHSLTETKTAPAVATLSVPTTSQDEAVGKALAPYIAQMAKGTNDNTVAIGKLVGVANTHQQQLDAHGAAIAELQSGLQAVAIRVTPTTEEGIRKVIEDELRGKGLDSNPPPAPVQPPAATGDASPPIPVPEEEVGAANPLDNDPAAMGPPPVYGDPSVLLADMSGGYRPPAHVGKPRCPSGFQFTDRGICERFNARALTPAQKATLASCDQIETKVVKLADGKDHLLQRCAN